MHLKKNGRQQTSIVKGKFKSTTNTILTNADLTPDNTTPHSENTNPSIIAFHISQSINKKIERAKNYINFNFQK